MRIHAHVHACGYEHHPCGAPVLLVDPLLEGHPNLAKLRGLMHKLQHTGIAPSLFHPRNLEKDLTDVTLHGSGKRMVKSCPFYCTLDSLRKCSFMRSLFGLL